MMISLQGYKGFKLLSAPKTVHQEMRILHEECGRIFLKSFENFRKSPKCTYCLTAKDLTVAGTLARVEKQRVSYAARFMRHPLIESGEYELLSEYRSNKVTIRMRHTACGTEFNKRPNDFQQGKGCPKCANLRRLGNLGIREKTLEEVKAEISILGKGEYTLLSEHYSGNKEKLHLRHEVCQTEYHVRFNDFQQGYRCPSCALQGNTSVAVKEIVAELNALRIEFETEVRFEECRHKRTLPFDFCVYTDKANDEYFLIEYNGRQHYFIHPSSAWSDGRKCSSPEELQARDKKKQCFAKEYGLDLRVIRYDEDHLQVLRDILKEKGLM